MSSSFLTRIMTVNLSSSILLLILSNSDCKIALFERNEENTFIIALTIKKEPKLPINWPVGPLYPTQYKSRVTGTVDIRDLSA